MSVRDLAGGHIVAHIVILVAVLTTLAGFAATLAPLFGIIGVKRRVRRVSVVVQARFVPAAPVAVAIFVEVAFFSPAHAFFSRPQRSAGI